MSEGIDKSENTYKGGGIRFYWKKEKGTEEIEKIIDKYELFRDEEMNTLKGKKYLINIFKRT